MSRNRVKRKRKNQKGVHLPWTVLDTKIVSESTRYLRILRKEKIAFRRAKKYRITMPEIVPQPESTSPVEMDEGQSGGEGEM